MEFFRKTKAVKLRSHHDKYLIADEDQKNVRQSRNSSSRRAIWEVETVEHSSLVIRLRSCYGEYLAASETSFLLGMTGKKVFQTTPDSKWDSRVEWEPVREGFQVRLKTMGGKYLRANGGPPPWRNSVTHDNPTSATEEWVLWFVEPTEVSLSNVSFSESDDQSEPATPFSPSQQSGMEIFRRAKAVRLRSRHDKYLYAEDDEESVTQDRDGSSSNARWTVGFVSGEDDVIVLKSCHGKFLTASNQPFLLGATGRKVLQTDPQRVDSSLQWEPVKEGDFVKLRTRYGKLLRGNGGVPPWRNSVTHDVPHRSATQDWVLWTVDVVEIRVERVDPHLPPRPTPSLSSSSMSPASLESSESSPTRVDGRTIFYHIADKDPSMDEFSLRFKGNVVDELTRALEEETGITNIIVCSRSPLNGKLYPLRLHLPPNQADMHVVVVPSSSRAARDFETLAAPS